MKLRPAVESVSNHALIEAVRSGMGISILPRRLVLPFLQRKELYELTLNDHPLDREWYLIHHSRKALTAPMQEFINSCLNQNCKKKTEAYAKSLFFALNV